MWGGAGVSSAHISGEALPVRLGPGDEVAAGSVSHDGLVVVRVARGADDSTPARIARMATQARVGAGRGGDTAGGWGRWGWGRQQGGDIKAGTFLKERGVCWGRGGMQACLFAGGFDRKSGSMAIVQVSGGL